MLARLHFLILIQGLILTTALSAQVHLLDGSILETLGSSPAPDGIQVITNEGQSRLVTWQELDPGHLSKAAREQQFTYVQTQLAAAEALASAGDGEGALAFLRPLHRLVAHYSAEQRTQLGWTRIVELARNPPQPPPSEPDPMAAEQEAASAEQETEGNQEPPVSKQVPTWFAALRERLENRGVDPNFLAELQNRIARFEASRDFRFTAGTVAFVVVFVLFVIIQHFRHRIDWDDLTPRQARMEREDRALWKVRDGVYSGLFLGIVTAGWIIATLNGVESPIAYGWFTFVDVAIFLLLTLWMHYRSRIAALIMLLYFIYDRANG